MAYKHFETTVTIAGAAMALITAILCLSSGRFHIVSALVVALLLGVLIAAVRFGRRGGSVAALVASVVYFVAQTWVLGTVNTHLLPSVYLVVPVLMFGLIGIVFAQLLVRMKYRFTRYPGGSAMDPWSHLYSEGYLVWLLEAAFDRFRTHQEHSALIVLETPAPTATNATIAERRQQARIAGAHLVDSVRMIDHVSRLSDGRYAVLLARTNSERANKVAQKLALSTAKALALPAGSVNATVFTLPDQNGGYSLLADSLVTSDV